MAYINPWAEEYLRVVDRMWEEEAFPEGRAVLEGIFYEAPDYAKAHVYAAWYAEHQLRNTKSAERHYELALKFDPSFPGVYSNYGEFLMKEKRYGRMKDLVDTGMKHPEVDKASLMNDWGRMLELQEKYSEASAAYKEALRYTMNYWTMNMIKVNRRRARSKYHLFAAIYSSFV